MKDHCCVSNSCLAESSYCPTVLIIDDDPDVTRCLELVLANYDVNVIRDYCGKFGAWDATRNEPDVIITDYAMPNGDGQQLLEEVKTNAQTAHIPVIVFTGQRDVALASHLKQLGAASILYKPVHYQTLLTEIQHYVSLRELDWANRD